MALTRRWTVDKYNQCRESSATRGIGFFYTHIGTAQESRTSNIHLSFNVSSACRTRGLVLARAGIV